MSQNLGFKKISSVVDFHSKVWAALLQAELRLIFTVIHQNLVELLQLCLVSVFQHLNRRLQKGKIVTVRHIRACKHCNDGHHENCRFIQICVAEDCCSERDSKKFRGTCKSQKDKLLPGLYFLYNFYLGNKCLWLLPAPSAIPLLLLIFRPYSNSSWR